jgi:hypothetical protein
MCLEGLGGIEWIKMNRMNCNRRFKSIRLDRDQIIQKDEVENLF